MLFVHWIGGGAAHACISMWQGWLCDYPTPPFPTAPRKVDDMQTGVAPWAIDARKCNAFTGNLFWPVWHLSSVHSVNFSFHPMGLWNLERKEKKTYHDYFGSRVFQHESLLTSPSLKSVMSARGNRKNKNSWTEQRCTFLFPHDWLSCSDKSSCSISLFGRAIPEGVAATAF